MSELKVRLYQTSFNPSHPYGGLTQRISLRNSTTRSWERDNENNFAKLYFCPSPSELQVSI